MKEIRQLDYNTSYLYGHESMVKEVVDELLKHGGSYVEFTRIVDTFIRNHEKGKN